MLAAYCLKSRLFDVRVMTCFAMTVFSSRHRNRSLIKSNEPLTTECTTQLCLKSNTHNVCIVRSTCLGWRNFAAPGLTLPFFKRRLVRSFNDSIQKLAHLALASSRSVCQGFFQAICQFRAVARLRPG